MVWSRKRQYKSVLRALAVSVALSVPLWNQAWAGSAGDFDFHYKYVQYPDSDVNEQSNGQLLARFPWNKTNAPVNAAKAQDPAVDKEAGKDKESGKGKKSAESKSEAAKKDSEGKGASKEDKKTEAKAEGEAKSKPDKSKAKAEEGKSKEPRAKKKSTKGGEEAKSPLFEPDAALVSVLKDLARGLKNAPEVTKLQDSSQKAVVELAQQVLEKAVADPKLSSDRIVHGNKATLPMTAEAWASGNVALADGGHGSLAAVWAKHENGLFNVSIAGNCPNTAAPNGKKIGEFLVILSGKSTVDNGFDIQTQGKVDFWLGKLSGLVVESDCCNTAAEAKSGESKTEAEAELPQKEVKKNSTLVLQALLTERGRDFQERLRLFESGQPVPPVVATAKQTSDDKSFVQLVADSSKTESKAASTDPVEQSSTPATATSTGSATANSTAPTSTNSASTKSESLTGTTATTSTTPPALPSTPSTSSTPTKSESSTSASDTTKPTGLPTTALMPPAPSPAPSATKLESKVIEAAPSKSEPDSPGEEKATSTPAGETREAASSSESSTASKTPPTSTSDDTKEESLRIARATDDDKSKAASEAQSAPLPKDSTSALSWNQSIGSNSGAITNSAVGVANPWSKADPYELVKPAPKTEPTASAPPEVAMAGDTNASPAAPRGWESPAPTTATKLPSSSATLLLPTRAIAGQFLTASVLDSNHNGEQSVELSFNGAALLTDNKGQAVFMVPEDATPGRSLTIALASRPDLNPGVVDILQPLTIPDHQETPKIDRVSGIVSPGGTATIEGHNFDGQSDHNRVLVDGAMECKVTAASPVHLKALLPDNVPPGQHSISVVISGLKSNATPFIAIGADVHADPREAARDLMTKLIVRVVGTELKVNVHIRNLSPDVIKLTKGNEFTLASPGGANNSFVLGAQRLKKGNFKVEALVQ